MWGLHFLHAMPVLQVSIYFENGYEKTSHGGWSIFKVSILYFTLIPVKTDVGFVPSFWPFWIFKSLLYTAQLYFLHVW